MISQKRQGQLLDTLEGLLNKETPGANTPLQRALANLVNAVHSGLTGRALERAIQTSRHALGQVLQDLGMSAKDAQDLTRILADQEMQGQGSGGPRPPARGT